MALLAFGATLGLNGRAAAEPRLGVDRAYLQRQLVDLQRRARELDERIRRIEMELARDASARAVVPRAATPAAPTVAADCSLPIYLDRTGIKHLRPECLAPAGQTTCGDPPYYLDARGLRHFTPACESSADVPRAAE